MRAKIAGAGGLLFSAMTALASPVANPPAVPGMAATYDFYFSGIRAGELTVSADFGPDAYRAGAEFRTTGIVGFFSDTEMKVATEGRVGAAGLSPEHFTSNEREDSGRRVVEIAFSGTGPTSVQAAPAFRVKPWSIDAGDQHGATDPLSAVLQALAPAPADQVCDRRIEAFDGEHRFAFEFGPPRPEGDMLVCDGAYIRLAGFKPQKMEEQPTLPLRLSLAGRPDGLYQVVRLVSEVRYGAVIMTLRGWE